MERVKMFRSGEDKFAVPESELGDFNQEMQGAELQEVNRFRDEDGQDYEVPLEELDAFNQEMQGRKIFKLNTVKAGNEMFQVPENEASDFMSFYNTDPKFDEERQKTALDIAAKLDATDSPFWAGVKGAFGEGYGERASAGAANVLRGVAQAPATIADKVMAAEQFSSRVRNIPYVGKLVGMNPLLSPVGPVGMAAEAVTELIDAFKNEKKDPSQQGGSTYRGLIQKARDYIDERREKYLGFRNEKGEPAGEGDFLLTIGGQAANSVTEAYLLSAPAFMQKANAAISLGKFSPTIQTILYGTSTAEDTAAKAEKAGRSQAEQVALGALTGTLESALESVSQVFGLQKTMGAEPVRKALGRMIVRRAMDAAGEGVTEGAQEFQKAAIEKLSKIDEKTWTEIGMQSAQAAAAGLLSGGAAEISQASLAGIDTLQQRRQANELRANEEAAAVGMGRMAQQESVLEGDPEAAPQGEGAIPGQGPVESGLGQPEGEGLQKRAVEVAEKKAEEERLAEAKRKKDAEPVVEPTPAAPVAEAPVVEAPAEPDTENPLQRALREHDENMAEIRTAVDDVAPGVEIQAASPVQGDISVSPDGKSIRVQPTFLKRLKEMYPDNWREALRLAISEEVIHQRHIEERGGKDSAKVAFAKAWNAATPEEQTAVREAYGDGAAELDDAQLGAELERMREQAATTGTITESIHPKRGAAAARAVDVLNKAGKSPPAPKGALDQRPDDVLFNADLGAGSMAQGNAYNQETSGGAETPKAQQTRAPMEGGGNAGRFAVGMDLMDAVQLFYQLRGKMPKIRERMRAGVMGLFRPGTQDIELLAGIFGMYDQQDADRIKEALVRKGYEGERLANQIDVEVRALIEKRRTQNMKKPLKVMVHELAHYVDFLPDSELKRGNILGHIAALKRHLSSAIGPEPGAKGPLTEQEKAALRRRAEAEMKALLGDARTVIEEVTREVPEYAVLGIKPDDVVKALLGMDGRTATPELYDWFSRQDASVKREVLMAAMKGVIDGRMAALGSRVQTGTRTVTEQVTRDIPGYTKEDGRRRFRELLKQETEKRRLIELKQIKAEAESIIPWWRGAKEMEAYFRKPEEMYAELFGIFLADPSELRSRAPTVYRAFTGWMDARPEAAEAYRAYLDFRNLPAEQQARQKLANFKRGMEKGDEDSRREATELARKPGRWAAMDSFGYYFHRRTAPIKWALDRALKVLVDGAPTETEKAKVKDIYETALVGIKRQCAISRVIQDYEAAINARVADPLAKNGFDMLDLGVYQALRRVAYELDGKAAPAGVEPASALKLLESMRQEYGEQRWNALQEAAMEFRRIREARIISNPDLRAMYDKELLEKLDNNVEYVTFQRVPTMQEIQQFKDALRKAKSGDKLLREDVAEFLTREMENRFGSAVGAKIHRFVGSFGPVANPIVATLTKDDQLIRSATRNTLKRQIYEFVKESGLDLIREVQYEKNGQGVMVPKMVDDPNWKTVVFMQDGQVKGFLANRSLAKALETGRTDEIAALRTAMRWNSNITKLYTQLKYTFSYMNNIRDLERAANYVPGMERMRLAKGVNINFLPGGGMVSTLMRYKIPSELVKKVLPWTMNDRMIEWHLYQARRAAILIQSNTIDQAEAQAQELMRMGDTRKAEQLFDDVRLAREGLQNPILMSHIEAIREDSTADDYTRRLYRYGIQKDDVTKGLHMAARLAGMFKAYGRMVEGWGEVGELTTKLATWKYLEKHGQNMTPQQRILVTRELGGSPDFSERGAAASYIEAITSPFVNAAKEGTIGTISAFRDRPGETTRKLFSNVVAPTMVRHLLGSGLGLALLKIAIPDEEERKGNWLYKFMKWYYERMQHVPNYIMKNYHSYPVPVDMGETANNFTALIRMPMDQTSQVLSLITWNMMDSLGETLINELNSNNPNASPAVISRTEKPWVEIGESIASSFGIGGIGQAPLLGIIGLIGGFVTGINYYDYFKGQNVFNEDELISRWKNPAAAKKLLGELSNRIGGSMIKRYKEDNIFGEDLPTLGKYLNAPFIQPVVGTFFNVYTGGQAQMERKLKRIEKEFEAPVKVEAKNDFARAVKEGGGKSVNFSDDIISKMIPKAEGTYADLVRSQIYKEEFERLTSEYYRTKNIRETVGQPFYNMMKEDNPIMRDIRIDVTRRGL